MPKKLDLLTLNGLFEDIAEDAEDGMIHTLDNTQSDENQRIYVSARLQSILSAAAAIQKLLS